MSIVEPPLVAEIVKFDFEKLAARFEWPGHAHPFYQFDVVRGGDVSVELEGGQRLTAKTGDGLFFPPLTGHGYHSRRGFLNCTIKAEIFPFHCRLLPDAFQKIRLPPVLLKLVEHVGQNSKSGMFARQQVLALANLCFAQALTKNSKPGPHPDCPDAFHRELLRLCLAIQSGPQTGWTVSRMASECHLSTDYFTRCFRRVMGCSPKYFLLKYKFKSIAAKLILEPDYPIKVLAEEFGYATVHSFTKAFKHVIGTTPANYRRMPSRL